MELIFNPCGDFGEARRAYLHAGVPEIFSDLLSSVQMLKRMWCAESNGKLPNLFIPRKIAALFPEFAVEDLPLGRNAALGPEFAVKDLPSD